MSISAQYQALREKAEAYEQQLSEQIRALQNEQDRLIAEADARNFALRQKAQKALTGLERQIADACALPVDVFSRIAYSITSKPARKPRPCCKPGSTLWPSPRPTVPGSLLPD